MRTLLLAGTCLLSTACSDGIEIVSTVSPSPTAGQGTGPTSVFTPAYPAADYLSCLDQEGKAVVAAHRGGPAPGYPENALETLQRSVENGVWLLEIDIRTSRDGVLFLFHDEELDYETTGEGRVADMDWADLRTVSLLDTNREPTPYRLTRFEDVLRWADGKAILQLDIKRGTDYDDVTLAVRSAGAADRVIPIAYTTGQAFALNRKFPNSMISAPISSEEDFRAYTDRGIPADNLFAWGGTEAVNKDLYAFLDGEGVEVAFGTLGGRDSIDNQIQTSGNFGQYTDFVRAGADVLSTDAPLKAKEVLVKEGLWPEKNTCR